MKKKKPAKAGRKRSAAKGRASSKGKATKGRTANGVSQKIEAAKAALTTAMQRQFGEKVEFTMPEDRNLLRWHEAVLAGRSESLSVNRQLLLGSCYTPKVVILHGTRVHAEQG